MTSTTIWIVTPCYFDVASFLRLRKDISSAIVSTGDTRAVRFVLVDDSAGYDPQVEAVHALDDVYVVEPPFNLGHQRCLVFALRTLDERFSSDDIVVTMDADGEDQPNDVPKLLAAVTEDTTPGGNVVIARRTKRHEAFGFKAFYFCFRAVFRVLTGTVIRSGNFAAYRAHLAHRYLRHPYFDLCYSSTFISLGVPITYVPCERGFRYEGHSRMSKSRLILHGFRMLMPFIDRIAARAIGFLAFLVIFDALLISGMTATIFLSDMHIANWFLAGSFLIIIGTMIAIGCASILFGMLAQLRGISQSGLEVNDGKPVGTPSAAAGQ